MTWTRREALKAAFAAVTSPLVARHAPHRTAKFTGTKAIVRVKAARRGDIVFLHDQVIGVALETARKDGTCLIQMSGPAVVTVRPR